MKQTKDSQQIMHDYRVRQNRQFLAIALALVLLLLFVLLHSRSDLFGEIPRGIIFGGQITIIIAFVGFSAYNWRCPSCGKYLGSDISRRSCRHCRAKLC